MILILRTPGLFAKCMNQIWFMQNYSHEPRIVHFFCKNYSYEPKTVNEEYGSCILKFAWTKPVPAIIFLSSDLVSYVGVVFNLVKLYGWPCTYIPDFVYNIQYPCSIYSWIKLLIVTRILSKTIRFLTNHGLKG